MSHQDTGFRHPSPLDYRAFTRVWTRSTLQYVNFRLFVFLLLTKKAQERQTDRCEIEKAALLLLNRKIPFIGGVLPSLLALDDWKWKKRADIEIDRPYGMRFFRPRLLRMFEQNIHSFIRGVKAGENSPQLDEEAVASLPYLYYYYYHYSSELFIGGNNFLLRWWRTVC